jgi:hypothetical protein
MIGIRQCPGPTDAPLESCVRGQTACPNSSPAPFGIIQKEISLYALRHRCVMIDLLWIAAIALQNKAIVYDILLKSAAQTIHVKGAIQHLGGETGMIATLHTWADPDPPRRAEQCPRVRWVLSAGP